MSSRREEISESEVALRSDGDPLAGAATPSSRDPTGSSRTPLGAVSCGISCWYSGAAARYSAFTDGCEGAADMLWRVSHCGVLTVNSDKLSLPRSEATVEPASPSGAGLAAIRLQESLVVTLGAEKMS